MSELISILRQQLWRAYAALAHTLRRLQRDPHGPRLLLPAATQVRQTQLPLCPGQLHATYVLTRSEQGKDRLYMVPEEQRAHVRKWAAEYRRYQRARAVLVRRHARLLALVDQMAEQRLLVWPEKKPAADV